MKITADRKSLADTIGWVAKALPRTVNTPAMAGIRMRAEGDRLTLSAFDYEVSHEARVAVEIGADGECLAAGAFLATILGALTGKTVTLEVVDRELVITSGRSSYRTRLHALADYAKVPPGDKVEFTNSRGNPLVGEVLGPGATRGEIAVQVGEQVYNVRKERPTSYPRGSMRPAQPRDARGRLTR